MTAVLLMLVLPVALLFAVTRVGARSIARANPPAGSFVRVGEARIHYVHVPAADPDLPPVVALHGATANLKDQMLPLRPLFEGRAEMLFFDRPGLGWSQRGRGNDTLAGQAETIAGLMDAVGMRAAILIGHSYGGAVAAAFALAYPERTRGLVFLSAATHPWPGGKTSWYYDLSAGRFTGPLFVNTLAYPAGMRLMADAARAVFAPNPMPPDYVEAASIPLILRPSAFRANAVDVDRLYREVVEAQPRYRTIAAPTLVISGDRDAVVYEELHSGGLARDIPGAELVWVRNLGHKPDWVAPELVLAAVEQVAGKREDIASVVRAVEARIAADRVTAGTQPEGAVDVQPAVP